jgi:hypothetical protein
MNGNLRTLHALPILRDFERDGVRQCGKALSERNGTLADINNLADENSMCHSEKFLRSRRFTRTSVGTD